MALIALRIMGSEGRLDPHLPRRPGSNSRRVSASVGGAAAVCSISRAAVTAAPHRRHHHPAGDLRGRPAGFRRLQQYFDGGDLPEQFIG